MNQPESMILHSIMTLATSQWFASRSEGEGNQGSKREGLDAGEEEPTMGRVANVVNGGNI